ncbi:DUF1064 domain-containing protein [Bacillus manliponensis]|uniref:DUF1064 domain-containing protein n=1 Tax=Bacillus manliponensis TaxID=574376 RepID=UPI0030841C42
MAYTRRKQQKRKKVVRPKFKSKEVIIDNIKFDSKSEAAYYQYLKEREDVARIECHPSYTLIPAFEIKSSLTKRGKSKKSAMKFTPDF